MQDVNFTQDFNFTQDVNCMQDVTIQFHAIINFFLSEESPSSETYNSQANQFFCNLFIATVITTQALSQLFGN